jgi:vacuolar-type H+-ATPase subunit F/Vma7
LAGNASGTGEDITLIRAKGEPVQTRPVFPDRIIVIGDPAMVMGFKLAGVTEAYAAEGKAAEQRLSELVDRENAGIIIVEESLLSLIDWRLKRKIESLAKPVVIGVPGKSGSGAKTERLGEMIKRALGFDLGGK